MKQNRELVCLVEGRSDRVLLERLVPRIAGHEIDLVFVTFQGKRDLRERAAGRIRGWHGARTRFLVLCDQDGADCIELKSELAIACNDASAARAHPASAVLVRIACRELECWFLGDLAAVGCAFDKPGVVKMQRRAKYRDPDRQRNPVRELESLVGDYQKIEGARRLGPLLDLDSNWSTSFQAFRSGLLRLVADW